MNIYELATMNVLHPKAALWSFKAGMDNQRLNKPLDEHPQSWWWLWK